MLTAPFDDREKERYFLPDSGILCLSFAPTSLSSPLLCSALLCSPEVKSMLMLSDISEEEKISELPIIRLARAGWAVIPVLSPEQGEHKNPSQGEMC